MNDELHSTAQRFRIDAAPVAIERFGGGAVNDTYLIRTETGTRYVLQKLHPIFDPLVLHDTEAITTALWAKGQQTPLLIRTVEDTLGLTINGSTWRVLTFVPGVTIERNPTRAQIVSAGALIGSFHTSLAEVQHTFRFRIPDFHNVRATHAKFLPISSPSFDSRIYELLSEPVERLAELVAGISFDASRLPQRIIHDDLKISNVRFSEDGTTAVALLDLDTLARDSIVIDLGDAARSWCNLTGEDDLGVRFDLDTFSAMMEGYLPHAPFLTDEERAHIPDGIRLITADLAMRFMNDAFEQSYFKLDAQKYPTLFEQNATRAKVQLALLEDILTQKSHIEDIVAGRS